MDHRNNTDGALRVLQYMVHSSFAGVNKSIYHSSTYAAMNDAEYKLALQEVVDATSKAKQAIEADVDEQLSLA